MQIQLYLQNFYDSYKNFEFMKLKMYSEHVMISSLEYKFGSQWLFFTLSQDSYMKKTVNILIEHTFL